MPACVQAPRVLVIAPSRSRTLNLPLRDALRRVRFVVGAAAAVSAANPCSNFLQELSPCRTFRNVNQSVVKIDPEIMSGAPCFAGTRVPIQNLIDYLEGGDSIEEFLDGFPSVSREQVIAFLEEAKDRMVASVAE